MRLLRAKQVYWGPWLHYGEGKVTTCHHPKDSFTLFLLLLRDPKPTACRACHHCKPCPAGAMWSLKGSLISQTGYVLYLRPVNVLSGAYCRRWNPSCLFSMFASWQMSIRKPPQSFNHIGWQVTTSGDSATWAPVLLSITEVSPDSSSCCSVGPYKLEPRSAGQGRRLPPWLAHKQPKGTTHQV